MDILLFFFLGASLASFIGVVVERFPEKSLITPASHCQACGTTLPAWDLIPILSFLINRGRCRFCQVKLPIWYLLSTCLKVQRILCLLQVQPHCRKDCS